MDSPPPRSRNFIPSRKPSTHQTKTLKPETEDRISNLPYSILLDILTLLPLVDAIRTGSLSKRWNHLWVSIPNLIFQFSEHHFSDVSDFISFVDRTLILYNSHFINKFYIDFEYDVEFQHNVNSWLRFAVNHKVKHLHLLFHDSYILPSFLYKNGSITNLDLSRCSFKSVFGRPIINWSSLRKLSITGCSISDDVMCKLSIGCPVLERFELVRCSDFNKIFSSSRILKELVIDGYLGSCSREVKDVELLIILAPYLQLLVITGRMYNKKCRIVDLSSLVEARLSFEWSGLYANDDEDYYEVEENEDLAIVDFKTMLTDIFGRIKHVRKLTLGFSCLQAISLHKAFELPSIFSICKNLILDANLKKGGLPGLASMLQSCPELETLTIHLPSSVREPSRSHFYETEDFWTTDFGGIHLNCMQHLKMVKILELIPGCSQTGLVIEFLQYLLKYAEVLEKLSIKKSRCDRRSCASKDDLFAVAQALLKFPRSSPFAEILLN